MDGTVIFLRLIRRISYPSFVQPAPVKEKYLRCIDRSCKRGFKFGYTTKYILISDVIANRDDKMWKRITCNPHHSLRDRLPPNEGEYCVNVDIKIKNKSKN